MPNEFEAESFALDLEVLIGEYENKLAEEDTEAGKKRVTELLEACKAMNGKSLSDLLTLVDTGAFNNVISAYCIRAMNEHYDYDADGIVIPMLAVEVEEDTE